MRDWQRRLMFGLFTPRGNRMTILDLLVYIGIPLLILYLVYALWRDKTPWIWHEDQKLFTARAHAVESMAQAQGQNKTKIKGEMTNEFSKLGRSRIEQIGK